MSYTDKEELLKLGEIDPEFAAVRSQKPSLLRAPSSGLRRSLRSSICRHPTIQISMPSRKWSMSARRRALKRSVLLRQISSRPTTKSQYMTAQQFAFESTSQCHLQNLEVHSSSCKRLPLLSACTVSVVTINADYSNATGITEAASALAHPRLRNEVVATLSKLSEPCVLALHIN
jgi:hypothetical protein